MVYVPIENISDTDETSEQTRPYGSGKVPYKLNIFPTELEFAEVHSGDQGTPYSIILLNTGYADLIIEEISVVGPFEIVGTPPTEVPAEGTAEVTVKFTPFGTGEVTGGLYIDTGDAAGKEFIKLTGQAASAYALDLRTDILKATNGGLGSANAILATTPFPIPTANGEVLIAVNITVNNSGPSTIRFNGGNTLSIREADNSQLEANDLLTGTIVLGYILDNTFRLLTDSSMSAAIALLNITNNEATAAKVAAQTAAQQAIAAKNQILALSESISTLLYYDTYALAVADLANIPADQVIEIFEDETKSGDRTRYRKEGSILVFKLNLKNTITADNLEYDPAGTLLNDVDPPITTVSEAFTALAPLLAPDEDDDIPSVIFTSREAAQEADIPLDITAIMVQHTNQILRYVADSDGTALVTGGDRNWSPGENASFLHWGAVGDGETDDSDAIQAAFNFFITSEDSQAIAYVTAPLRVLEGRNRKYAIAKPIIMGNVGTTIGMIFHLLVRDSYFTAIAGTWSGSIVTDVPRQMFVLVWRLATDYADGSAGIFNLSFENCILNCNYLTGGIFWENTNSCGMRRCRVSRMGASRTGIQSSVGGKAGNSRDVGTGNGAFTLEDCNIAGIEEEIDSDFPPGTDQITANTIGLRWQTNDARINNLITSRVTQAWYFDFCGAIQILNSHPWSREIYLGGNANNIMFSNVYFDYTKVKLQGAFSHYFVGCHWILGETDRGLELVATSANTTGDGLVISGCRFRLGIGITFSTTGAGSWVTILSRKITLMGNKFDTSSEVTYNDYLAQLGDSFHLAHGGFATFKGGASFGGFLTVNNNRITAVGTPASGATGALHATPRSYVDSAASDSRVKDIKGTLEKEQGVNIIKQVNPIVYQYKQIDDTFDDVVHWGVIAQEVEHYFPYAVINNGLREFDDGSVIENFKGVDYRRFIMPLILTSQHLLDEVKGLKEEIKLLKGE